MKKSFVYWASLCAIALVFAACSSDDGGTNPPAPTVSGQSIVEEAFHLKFDENVDAPFREVVFTETRRAIVGPILVSAPATAKRLAGSNSEKYVIGTYRLNGNTYTIYNEDGSEYCTVTVESKTGSKTNVQIRMQGALEFDGQASIGEKIASDEITTTLCREWTIATTRLRHKNGVTAVKQFDNPQEAASLNAILEYAQSVATIDESFNPGMFITSIEFVSNGTFCIFFQNGENYIGKWEWSDKSTGHIRYNWNEEDMGNAFESGEAVFDIRKFQKVNYYTVTFGAEIVSDKTYYVELSFYLNEK